MKKILLIISIIGTIFTVNSCDIFAHELTLDYNQRMAYSLYSASSILTRTDIIDIEEINYNYQKQSTIDDPIENYLVEQVDYYYSMFEKYIGKDYDDISSIATDVDLIDGYNHSFNFMINSINYHVAYNELDIEVTDDIDNIEGVMYVGTGDEQIILSISGVSNNEENTEHLRIKASNGDEYVSVKLDDGIRGSTYKYQTYLNGVYSSMRIKTMEYHSKVGFEVTETINGEKNKFKFYQVDDNTDIVNYVSYDFDNEKGVVKIMHDSSGAMTYEISEGKRKGHIHNKADKRNSIFKNDTPNTEQ